MCPSKLSHFKGAVHHTCLLAFLSADNDASATTELSVGTLVLTSKKCGLKNLVVINPPPSIGPLVHLVKLNLWPTHKARRYSLAVDKGSEAVIRGVLFSRLLSKQARASKLGGALLTAEDGERLKHLVFGNPNLKVKLDLTKAYTTKGRTVLLEKFELAEGPEQLVLLLDPKAKAGYWSVKQMSEDGRLAGGFTIQSIARE